MHTQTSGYVYGFFRRFSTLESQFFRIVLVSTSHYVRGLVSLRTKGPSDLCAISGDLITIFVSEHRRTFFRIYMYDIYVFVYLL